MANKIDYRLDENGLAHLWQRIKLLVTNNVSNKVDKVSGKGLSTNDYTNAEKTKLAGIADGAQKNVQPDWALTSGDGAIKNKPTIPTKVSQLTNDSSYQNDSDVNAAISTELNALRADSSQDNGGFTLREDLGANDLAVIYKLHQINGKIGGEIAPLGDAIAGKVQNMAGSYLATQSYVSTSISNAVGKITSFEYKIVSSLPSTSEGKKGVIYLVAHSGSTTNNVYDEYIFLPAEASTAARYEKIGTTDIDLTPYAKKTEIPTKVSQLENDENFTDTANVARRVVEAINKLDYSDTAEEGKYVSSVSETDGVISVTRANFADAIPAITETEIDNICTF